MEVSASEDEYELVQCVLGGIVRIWGGVTKTMKGAAKEGCLGFLVPQYRDEGVGEKIYSRLQRIGCGEFKAYHVEQDYVVFYGAPHGYSCLPTNLHLKLSFHLYMLTNTYFASHTHRYPLNRAVYLVFIVNSLYSED